MRTQTLEGIKLTRQELRDFNSRSVAERAAMNDVYRECRGGIVANPNTYLWEGVKLRFNISYDDIKGIFEERKSQRLRRRVVRSGREYFPTFGYGMGFSPLGWNANY